MAKNDKSAKKIKKEPQSFSSRQGSNVKNNITKLQAEYIVGMGGSAGSLEAFEQFFSKLPANTGMAFVIVQHLDPTHKDIMPELLQRFTKMSVYRAEDGMRVKSNCVYVIPPNKDMSILHGKLQLLEPSMPRGLRMPIDFFLRNLADDVEDRAIGIIFSGMGTDGTLGLKAIKAKLGMVMVQSIESAKYDGMPRSAMETGLVDYVLSAQEMPAKLITYVKHFFKVPREVVPTGRHTVNALQKIFILLRGHTGHDFSFYKKNTIYRRIERRMSVHQFAHITKYVNYLQENPQELTFLFKELLIGVTNFFRDQEAFEILKHKIFPLLVKDKPKGSIIRVWVAGCSTGEEAYSLAIILKEYIEHSKQRDNLKFQIFATDIDKEAIEHARQGLYPSNISVDVSAERLAKFFVKEDSSYRVKKEIREMVIFAPQNIIMDPPFTKLDILACRNLLIYLAPELQKKILPLFHYALNPGGILFLGASETIGTFQELFSTLDSKWKVFKRRESVSASRTAIELPSSILPKVLPKRETELKETKGEASLNIADLAQAVMLDFYAPAAVFINEDGDIIFVNGRTGKYLEPAAGKANMNIFTMAREGLRFELASAIHKAVIQKQEIVVNRLKVKTNGKYQLVNLMVKPFTRPQPLQGLLMVAFQDVEAPTHVIAKELKTVGNAKEKAVITDLTQELKYTKEHLQTTVEEMETSQEELKSTNEELQSTNEELQSTNEELTTSKEELQSLNEELVTVNAELQNKVEELSRSNNDMKNLLNSTELATIFLDNELNIKRFTSPATKIINLIQSDIGRPVSHIVSNLEYENLTEDVKEVLTSLVFKEIQVRNKDGNWYLMRIIPYRTAENVIDGVVITFVDISALKKIEKSLMEAEERCRKMEEKKKST